MNFRERPDIFQVEITNHCSLACTFCPHPDLERPKAFMSPAQFRMVAQYFHPLQRVGIYLLGEPLLHPKFYELAKITKEFGAIPEISTNGLHFSTVQQRQMLLDAELGYINCDITRWKETKRRMDVVIENVTNLVNDALYLPDDHPTQIAVQIVSNRDHVEDFPDFIKEAALLKPERIRLNRKFLDTWAGQKKELYDVTEVAVPTTREACIEPWQRVAVLVNGDVVPCCRDAQGWTVYGNLFLEPLQAIWHGPIVSRIRSQMLSGDWEHLPEPCRSCREWHLVMDRRNVTGY